MTVNHILTLEYAAMFLTLEYAAMFLTLEYAAMCEHRQAGESTDNN
jgi:hypothetical protein